jgi:2-polyprenyl-3-methyl-5-hydroxy-6-metoxy-1,4-benzoquinol methylase
MTTTAASSGVIYETVQDPAAYADAYNTLMREPTNRLRVAAVVETAAAIGGPVRRVLDVASGGGAYTTPLARTLGIQESAFVPVDRQFACVAGYRLNHPAANPALANVTSLPFRAGSFDLAVCLDIVEHLDDDAAFLRNVAATVRPGGWVLLSTHNSSSLEHLIGLATSAIRGTTWRGWDPTHVRFYNAPSLGALAAAADLDVVAMNGTYYIPFHFPARLVSWPLGRLGFPRLERAVYQIAAVPGRMLNAAFEAVSHAPLLAGLGFGIVMLARKRDAGPGR